MVRGDEFGSFSVTEEAKGDLAGLPLRFFRRLRFRSFYARSSDRIIINTKSRFPSHISLALYITRESCSSRESRVYFAPICKTNQKGNGLVADTPPDILLKSG